MNETMTLSQQILLACGLFLVLAIFAFMPSNAQIAAHFRALRNNWKNKHFRRVSH